jgi:inhibitor of cysteine peptidase
VAVVTLDEKRNGSDVEVYVGDVVSVRLRENPTTGFRWRWTDAGGVLSFETSSFEPGDPSHPGAGGVRRVEFRAAEKGRAELALTLARGFEPAGTKPADFRVRVTVTVS